MQGRLCGSRRNRAFSSSTLRSAVVRWRSRVGQARRDGPTRPITKFDRGRASVLQQARRTAAFVISAAPSAGSCAYSGRPSLQGRTPPTLLSYTLLSPLRVALLPIGITKPTPRIDSSIHGIRRTHRVTRLPGNTNLRIAGLHRARSHQHDGKKWSDIWFTAAFSNHLDASGKRESRLLCCGTAGYQHIVSPPVPSFRSQTTLKC
jgi:hypothetical protein